MTRSIEQRLYEALRRGGGIRLSADDVLSLVKGVHPVDHRIAFAVVPVGGVYGSSLIIPAAKRGVPWERLGEEIRGRP